MESAQQMNHLAVQNFLFIYYFFVSFFCFPLYPVCGLTLFHIALHTKYSVSLGAFLLCALLQKISIANFHKFACNLVRYPCFTDKKRK